jgi:HPt (histidine-containing phosphotransfer) domain-containing protein
MNDTRPPDRPGAPEPSLDEAALARLRELDPDGRHGVLNRVLVAFQTSLLRMQAHLEAELPAPDPEVLKSTAHTLKASSAAVGALNLSRCCADIERDLREGRPVDLAAEVRRLLAELASAQDAVGAMLRP